MNMEVLPIPPLLLELAYVALKRGDFAAAQLLLQAARELRPQDPAPLFLLGLWHIARRDPASAEHSWRSLLERHPTYDIARVFLAESLLARHRPLEAEVLLQEVIEADRCGEAVLFARKLLEGIRRGVFQPHRMSTSQGG